MGVRYLLVPKNTIHYGFWYLYSMWCLVLVLQYSMVLGTCTLKNCTVWYLVLVPGSTVQYCTWLPGSTVQYGTRYLYLEVLYSMVLGTCTLEVLYSIMLGTCT